MKKKDAAQNLKLNPTPSLVYCKSEPGGLENGMGGVPNNLSPLEEGWVATEVRFNSSENESERGTFNPAPEERVTSLLFMAEIARSCSAPAGAHNKRLARINPKIKKPLGLTIGKFFIKSILRCRSSIVKRNLASRPLSLSLSQNPVVVISHLQRIEEIDGDMSKPREIRLIERRGYGRFGNNLGNEFERKNHFVALIAVRVKDGDPDGQLRPLGHPGGPVAERVPLKIPGDMMRIRLFQVDPVGQIMTIPDLVDRCGNSEEEALRVIRFDINLQGIAVSSHFF
jgi:hypothetical protein